MRTQIKHAHLHDSCFVGGTNLGDKLDPAKRTGMKMEYDEDRRCLYVTWNGETRRVMEPSIFTMAEGEVEKKSAQPAPTARAEAQVTTPMSHVFAGPGAGDTGVGKRTK
jgi:hypothetical protein